MRGLTYPDLAARYEVDACFDGCFRNDHWRGAVDSQGIVHWADRKMTRSGLRRFLVLVSKAHAIQRAIALGVADQKGVTKGYIAAWAVWYHAMWAYRTALHDLGIRLPAKLAEADKAKVRALLATESFELRNSRVGRWSGIRPR